MRSIDRIARNSVPLVGALLLAACVSTGPGNLSAGASEADLIARMGKPSGELSLADGGRQLEYARGPCGHFTFMVNVGRDGKVRDIQQVLQESYFAKVQPGLTQPEIIALLGHPGRALTYEKINDVVWTYRIEQAGFVEAFLNVHFDLSGKVTGTSRRTRTSHEGACDYP